MGIDTLRLRPYSALFSLPLQWLLLLTAMIVGVSVSEISVMATVSLAFRWLDMLEKEFDKAFVDLDLLLGEIDPDQCELTYDGRQKMTALSAAFAQLCHKAQTIFQSNAKLEVNVNSIM